MGKCVFSVINTDIMRNLAGLHMHLNKAQPKHKLVFIKVPNYSSKELYPEPDLSLVRIDHDSRTVYALIGSISLQRMDAAIEQV